MFGKNPVAKSEVAGDGKTLHVVEGSPFYTIQGEGPFAGEAAVFLRLHGCPLRCFFCDTEFSGPNDPTMTVEEIMSHIGTVAPSWCKLLVLTGGEPTRQNLGPLVSALMREGWTVQLETAGVFWQDCLRECYIVVCPKTATIHPMVQRNAAAFKYVIQVGQVDQDDGLPITNTQIADGKPHRLSRPREGATAVYLSPMDEYDTAKNAANLAEVGRLTLKYGYRAGVQLHKMLNLP